VRDDFRPDSDLDFLVSFSPNVSWGLPDHVAVERSHNWIRRKAILESAEVLYAA
jgi:hypothetical protein